LLQFSNNFSTGKEIKQSPIKEGVSAKNFYAQCCTSIIGATKRVVYQMWPGNLEYNQNGHQVNRLIPAKA